MKYPPALTDKEWDSLIKKLDTPPTEKQKRLIRQSSEIAKDIKTHK